MWWFAVVATASSVYVARKNVAKAVARLKNCNAYPIRAVAFAKLGILPVSAATPKAKNNSSKARRVSVTRSVVVVFRGVVGLVVRLLVLLLVVVLASRRVTLTSSRMAAIARGTHCNHDF